MKTRAQLLADMEALVALADSEQREMTPEEVTSFDAMKAQVDAIDANSARRALVVAARATAPVIAAPTASAPVVVAVPSKPGDEAPKTFANIGEFFHAALLNPSDARLEYQNFEKRGEQRMDTGALGGFMVPEQFVTDIRRVDVQSALVRPRATVIPAGSPPDAKITFPYLDQSVANGVFGGVAVAWVDGEGGTKPASTGNLGQFSLQPNEWAGVITVTDKLLRNWTAAAAYFTKQLRDAQTSFEDFAFFRTGTGSGEPLSIINSPAALSVTRQTSAHFTFNDAVGMLAKLLDKSNAVWSISQTLFADVVQMRNATADGGDGSLVYMPGNITAGIPATLLGYPVYWNTRAPAAAAKGAVALLDLSHYIIKDGSGPFVASDGGIVNFVNNKTLVKVFGNTDGQPDMKEPFTGEDSYTLSPFVLLAAG